MHTKLKDESRFFLFFFSQVEPQARSERKDPARDGGRPDTKGGTALVPQRAGESRLSDGTAGESSTLTLYIYLSIYLSIRPSIYLSIHLSIYIYIYIAARRGE